MWCLYFKWCGTFLALDNFQTNLHRELDPLHFKGKWRGSGSFQRTIYLWDLLRKGGQHQVLRIPNHHTNPGLVHVGKDSPVKINLDQIRRWRLPFDLRLRGIGWTSWNSCNRSFETWSNWWVLQHGRRSLIWFCWVQIDHTSIANRSALSYFWKIIVTNSLKIPNWDDALKPHSKASNHTSLSSGHDHRAWIWSSKADPHLSHTGSLITVRRTRLAFVGMELRQVILNFIRDM